MNLYIFGQVEFISSNLLFTLIESGKNVTVFESFSNIFNKRIFSFIQKEANLIDRKFLRMNGTTIKFKKNIEDYIMNEDTKNFWRMKNYVD